jgi:hypothetical protein
MPLNTIALFYGLTVLLPLRLSAQNVPSTVPFDERRGDAVAGLSEKRAQDVDGDTPDVTSRDGSAVAQNAGTASSSASGATAPAGQDQSTPQDTGAPPPPHPRLRALFQNLGEDLTRLPSMPNLYIAALGGGLALAAHRADSTLNAKLRSHYDLVNTVFAPGKYLGDTPEQVAMALATFAYGKLADQPKVSHLANDLLQAQLLSGILVEPLKFATQRLRPYQTGHCGVNCSFPSGHTAITFADATVIERHLGWKYTLIGYAVASYIGVSRLHDNQHYLSDVVFGAAVGSIAGRTVVHHSRDYWAFTPTTLPGGGVAIVATRTCE